MTKIYQQAKEALHKAAEKMKKAYDKHCKASHKYNEGDLIWLEGRNIQTKRPMKKLDNKWYRPFKIKKVFEDGTHYSLKLPTNWQIHDKFNEVHLSPYTKPCADNKSQPNLPWKLLINNWNMM